eukprot:TRINITY_DN3083_c0_g1_i3.p1 TRINITY_DN3083_c0_g1~~TRINITY_DN3083_c0_g1_i3.p1  ORF type:complete len:975 (+),score=300.57 TRINITY_DN3083_c0_g1_i3:47-2926(+)
MSSSSGSDSSVPREKGRGIVRAVPYADCIIISPAEPALAAQFPEGREVVLSNVSAPKLARGGPEGGKDEPYAWEAREFIRKKAIGKRVYYTIDNKVASGRGYGTVSLADTPDVSLNTLLVQEGWARAHLPPAMQGKETAKLRPELQALLQAEETARAAGKGVHNKEGEAAAVRPSVSYDAIKLYQQLKGKTLTGVVEQVRNGSTVRITVLPTFHSIILLLSGVQCPGQRKEPGAEGAPPVFVPEPFYKEAKAFAETNLLNREVSFTLDGVDKQNNFFGSIQYVGRDVAEEMLRQGFGTYVAWSATPRGAETCAKLREAERGAREKKARVWSLKHNQEKAAQAGSSSSGGAAPREFSGKVVDIVNPATFTVVTDDGVDVRVTLSSVRAPNIGTFEEPAGSKEVKDMARYERAWALEGKEFLRRRLIGQRVKCSQDYIRPAGKAADGKALPERSFWTVYVDKMNIAIALVENGYATVVQHRGDDDRSPDFQELVLAEQSAQSKSKGLHAPRDKAPAHRVNDLTQDLEFESKHKAAAILKAKGTLPFLQRAGLQKAVIEYVFSGQRFKLFIPKETCVIFFTLTGVKVPRRGENADLDALSNQALQYARQRLHQRDVMVQIDNIDKGGNFLGNLFFEKRDFGVSLAGEGFASITQNAGALSNYRDYVDAEEKAKTNKRGIWKNYDEAAARRAAEEAAQEEAASSGSSEGGRDTVSVVITEVLDGARMYVQIVGPEVEALETLVQNLQIAGKEEDEQGSFVPEAFKPRAGDIVRGQFSEDNTWYRAKILEITDGRYKVLYIDYGNSETLPFTSLRPLPSAFVSLPAQANEAVLAYIRPLGAEEDYAEDAFTFLRELVLGHQLTASVESREGNKAHVGLRDPESGEHVNAALLGAGLAKLDKKHRRHNSPLFKQLEEVEEKARSSRVGIWHHGHAPDSDEDEDVDSTRRKPAWARPGAAGAKGKK